MKISLVLLCGFAHALIPANSSIGRDDPVQPDVLLDRAMKAVGEPDKLQAARYVEWSGLLKRPKTTDRTWRHTVDGLDKLRRNEGPLGITLMSDDRVTRYAGGNIYPMNHPLVVRDSKLFIYRHLFPTLIAPLKSKGFKIESVPPEAFDGKPANGIRVTGPNECDFRLYFDRETHLAVRILDRAGRDGKFPMEIIFSEHKRLNGLMVACKIETWVNKMLSTTETVEDFRILQAVDPKQFTEP